MPPPKAKKLTAQPVRTRQFAGKPTAVEPEERSSSESESEEEQPKQKPFAKPKPAPIASSFPKSALKSKLASRQKSDAERKALEDEFETESEEEEGEDGSESESGSGSEEESSEEESSSEEEAPKKLLRPVFLKKNQRNQGAAPVKSADEIAAEEEARRQEQSRALVQEQVEQRIAEKAAGKKDWDDDVEEADINAIDDTDGLDPDAEYAAWKLRELKRIKRERLAIEEAEAERAEIERRRNLSAAEREAEDRAFIEKQQEERGDRGQAQFMQKYFHKGAFFTEELKELGVDRRNLMNARFEDQTNREVLPEYMQIRDMTKLGKKGRTRYKDMRSEDTGRWGDFGDDRPRRDRGEFGVDERFRPDSERDREGATGANAKPLGERKRFAEDSERDSKRPKIEERA
jgi:microfibrillar-associated protein 1